MTIGSRLFELPTEAVDNSVGNWFPRGLTIGFCYIFVTLDNFKTIIYFIIFSMSYKIVIDKNTAYIGFLILSLVPRLNVCITIKSNH